MANPPPAPARMEAPSADALPVFKLRPKKADPPPPPSYDEPAPEPDMAPPEPYAAPPPPMPSYEAPRPPRGSVAMPPLSVLSAPPPPPPGGAPDAPAVPGAVPRLSLSTPSSASAAGKPPSGKPPINIKVAGDVTKVGGRPVVKPGKPGKPGKAPTPASVLGKRAAVPPMAKVGIGVLAVAVAIGGVYSYKIFFPTPSHEVSIKIPPITLTAKSVVAAASSAVDAGQDAIAKRRKEEQAKLDAAAAGEDVPTPTPTPNTAPVESVMAQTDITSDVKVDATHLNAAPAASAAFRTFVANASIGGVFQGTPSRALINGSIVREGQLVDNSLGIEFERIDAEKKAIFFKDATGAEVSKDY